MSEDKLSVLLSSIRLTEAMTLEQIADRIRSAKEENPELIPEVKDIYVRDGNLVLDIDGLLFEVDGEAVIELSRHRIPEA